MLSNIIYGTSRLIHGGLEFGARAAGKRGEEITVEIISGVSLSVSATVSALGKGTIQATVTDLTTESQLIAACKANASFLKLATIEQKTGDGSAIVSTLAKSNLQPATDGLVQFLTTKLGVTKWDDRDLIASGAPVGLILFGEAKIEKQNPVLGAFDIWSGAIEVGIAFQHKSNYEIENCILDLFRRGIFLAVKQFSHPDLCGTIGPASFIYKNKQKDEAAGTTRDDANLLVAAMLPLKWKEPAFDPQEGGILLQQFRIALWNEPVTDIVGPGGNEIKDYEFTFPQE